jgi:hypothetical protein
MSFPVEAFWKLLVDSQLVGFDDARQYHASWTQQYPQGDAQQLAEWLVAGNLISRYQASILLAGRAGPFVYGDYRIYDRIEKGRLAGIFRAVHVPTMHRVCLQFLTGEQAATPEAVAYLAQQSALVSRTSAGYPHLLRCYHLVDLGQFKFFVLEDLQGKRIERIVNQKGALPAHEACRVARHAALGLARLHAMQQPHGDVRPANIWADSSGVIKMVLFPLSRNPLAKPIDWRKLLAGGASSEIPDEADYVAPELIAGDRAPDARSDIYELGCSMYFMLTKHVPFPGKTLREKLEGHLKGRPVPIEKLNPSVPSDLAKLVGYLMQKKPDMRYQQVSSVIEKLQPFLAPADAQWQPLPPSRIEQAYEGYLHQYLSAPIGQAPMASAPMAGGPMSAAPMAGAPTAPAYGGGMSGGAPMAAPAMGPAPMGGAPMAAAARGAPGMVPAGPPAPAAPAPPVGPRIRGAETSFASRRRKSNGIRNLVALIVVLGGGGAAAYFVPWDKVLAKRDPLPGAGSAGGAVAAAPTTTPTASPTATPTPTATAVAPTGTVIPARDNLAGSGDPIYASPTAGAPLDLSHFVPGAGMIIALRPADIMAIPNKDDLLIPEAVGDLGPWLINKLPVLAGTANENIEQVIVGILDGTDASNVRASYVIRTKEAIPEESLLNGWGNPAEMQIEDAKTFVKDGIAYYLPPAGNGKVIVIAPQAEMTEVVKSKGMAFPLPRREMDVMLQSTDADRHLTILYAPYFLEAGGRSLAAGRVGRGIVPLNWLATGYGLPATDGSTPPTPSNPDDALPPKAVVFSAHCTDTFFWELRFYNQAVTADNDGPAGSLAARIKEAPTLVDNYLIGAELTAYAKLMLLRKFPPMMKFAANNVRAATGEKQLVLRGYLPAMGAQNLLVGGYLALLEGGGVVSGGAAPPPVPAGKQKPQNATEALKYQIAMSFTRNPLDGTMAMISEEIGIPIKIIGTDLQLEGITQNQSFGLDEKEQPLDQLLRTIFIKCNPDGKLVYQIKPAEGGGPDMIYITTRAAVEKRKEKLPDVFVTAPPKK